MKMCWHAPRQGCSLQNKQPNFVLRIPSHDATNDALFIHLSHRQYQYQYANVSMSSNIEYISSLPLCFCKSPQLRQLLQPQLASLKWTHHVPHHRIRVLIGPGEVT
jgi:hypothetical protein